MADQPLTTETAINNARMGLNKCIRYPRRAAESILWLLEQQAGVAPAPASVPVGP